MFADSVNVPDPATVMKQLLTPSSINVVITDYMPSLPPVFLIRETTSRLAAYPTKSLTTGSETTSQPPADWSSSHAADDWLPVTLEGLSVARAHAEPAIEPLLDAAELLIPHFAQVDPALRPQLAFTEGGQPTFGASRAGFYLDLTIDSPTSLSWYADVDDKEFFGEDVGFTGRTMPAGLRDIFAV